MKLEYLGGKLQSMWEPLTLAENVDLQTGNQERRGWRTQGMLQCLPIYIFNLYGLRHTNLNIFWQIELNMRIISKISGRNIPRERSDIELCDLSKSILHRLIRANEDAGKRNCKQLRKMSFPCVSTVIILSV